MLAASIADIDGVGVFFGTEYYFRYHHILAHNLFFAIVVAGILSFYSMPRGRAAVVYTGAFMLHLLMDSFGSGEGWGLALLWPLSDHKFLNSYAWDFRAWQNMLALFGVVIWTLGIAIFRGHTPLECVAPKLDRLLVDKLKLG